MDWEIAVNKWLQDCVEDGEIVEVNAKIVARYKIRRDVYLAHMKMAERRARRAAESSPGDLDTLTAILGRLVANASAACPTAAPITAPNGPHLQPGGATEKLAPISHAAEGITGRGCSPVASGVIRGS